MEISITPEMEAQIHRLAVNTGRGANEVVLEILNERLAYDAWLLAEVEKGRASLAADPYISHEEMKSRFSRYLETDADPLV